MGPGEALAFLAAVAGISGTTITLAVSWMRHRERMAGLRGKGASDTVQLLTETLEKQHDKQQTLERRLAAIERGRSAPTSETAPDAAPAPVLALPDDDAVAYREPATEPVRARVSV